MRTIRMDLEYDGRNYVGWQCQSNGISIQETLERVLVRVLNHPVRVQSCGRTDAGVHAEQHVAQVETDSAISCYNLMQACNSLLPDDMAVYRVLDMPPGWSSRSHAVEREYCYRFWVNRSRSVHQAGRSHWIRQRPDVQAMRIAARFLEGQHDFSAFRSVHCTADHAVRSILQCTIIEEASLLAVRIRGHAFLRHQVRIMAGTLLEVGQGKRTPGSVEALLETGDRNASGPTLPPNGLTLVAVRYPDDDARGIGRYRYPQPGQE